MAVVTSDVRFRGQSGHPAGLAGCLLLTQVGSQALDFVVAENVAALHWRCRSGGQSSRRHMNAKREAHG